MNQMYILAEKFINFDFNDTSLKYTNINDKVSDYNKLIAEWNGIDMSEKVNQITICSVCKQYFNC